MQIYDYTTKGGKNLILSYIDKLPNRQRQEAYEIRKMIQKDGMLALQILNTRQLKGKLYEIKFSGQRIMYVVRDKDSIYFLHMCSKQKSRTERIHLQLAIKRARETGVQI